MKFVSFISAGRASYGVVRDDGVIDLGRMSGIAGPHCGRCSPQAP